MIIQRNQLLQFCISILRPYSNVVPSHQKITARDKNGKDEKLNRTKDVEECRIKRAD